MSGWTFPLASVLSLHGHFFVNETSLFLDLDSGGSFIQFTVM